jgi:uroporphyrinogen-III synthase
MGSQTMKAVERAGIKPNGVPASATKEAVVEYLATGE